MPDNASIAAAMQLAQKNAERILQTRDQVHQRRNAALDANDRALSMRVHLLTAGIEAPPTQLRTSGFLAAAGDSWFAYPFHDVLKDLEDIYGYNVESTARAG